MLNLIQLLSCVVKRKDSFHLKEKLCWASGSPGRRQRPKSQDQSWVLSDQHRHLLENLKKKKKKTEETFQGEPLHAVKNTQVLWFLWKIMSCRLSTDLGWWCLELLFRYPVDHSEMWMLPRQVSWPSLASGKGLLECHKLNWFNSSPGAGTSTQG